MKFNMKFNIEGKQIEVFYKETECKRLPVILLNVYGDEGKKVWEECLNLKVKDFILVAISNLNWNDDMTPWECSPLYKGDSKYNGNADNYLKIIEDVIISNIEEFINNSLHKEIDYFGIAGYSLGGLFAVYSVYNTNLFSRIASVSGSLWFPNFVEYIKENEISKNVDKIYFSLGNKEKFSEIDLLRTVEDKTKEIQKYLGNMVDSIYEENMGNHFQDGAIRMAKGIKWIVD